MILMHTYTGRSFPVDSPTVGDIDIEDIAHSLSTTCRFCGHSKQFYSVAQHSVIGASYIAPEFAKWFLLHDASEAYVNDVIKPQKQYLPLIKTWEDNILSVIAEKFSLPWPIPDEVKEMDKRLLATEIGQVLNNPSESLWSPWLIDEPLDICIVPWSWEDSKAMFLNKFHKLFTEETINV